MKLKYDQIVQLSEIHKQCAEIAVNCNTHGKFHWYFRCVSSEDNENTEDGFDTPVEAIAAFSQYMINGLDEDLGNRDEEE